MPDIATSDRWICWVLQERRQEKAAERERKQVQGLEQDTAAATAAATGTQAEDQLGDGQKPDLDTAETPGDRSGAEGDDDDDDDEDNADQNGES